MCQVGARAANIAASSLVFIIGKLFMSPMPGPARSALVAFAQAPSDPRLQALVTELRDHRLLAQVHGVAQDIRLFGGLEAVLEVADQQHVADFQSAMAAMTEGQR